MNSLKHRYKWLKAYYVDLKSNKHKVDCYTNSKGVTVNIRTNSIYVAR